MTEINKIFSTQIGATMSLTASLTMVGCALVLGLLIAAVYMITSRRTGFRKDTVLTLTFIPAVVCAIIVLVGNNVVYALSMGGIFTLVRWRSLPSTQRDLIFTLFSVAAGAACGIGYIAYGALFTLVIGVFMLLLSLIRFGESKATVQRLRITVPEDLNVEGTFDEVLKKYTTSYELMEMRSSNFGSLYDLIYVVRLSPKTSRKDFIDAIRVRNGNLNVSLTLYEIEKSKK